MPRRGRTAVLASASKNGPSGPRDGIVKGYGQLVTKVGSKARAWLERARAIDLGAWSRYLAQPGVWRERFNQLWRRLPDMGVLGLLAAIHSILGRPFLFAPMTFDEQFFLFEGFSLGRGLVPYRDFQELKPPAIFLVNMLALRLFGLPDFRFRYFLAALSMAAFLTVAIALLSRRVPRLLVLTVVALMMSHFFDGTFHDSGINNSETVGLDFYLLGIGVLLLETRHRRGQQITGGVLLALTALSKEPFCAPVLATWLALMALRQNESGEPGAWRSFAKHTVGGAVGLGLLWLGYMLVTRSLGAYLIQLRQIMVYSAEHNVMYGVFPKLSFLGTLKEFWRRLQSSYVNAPHLILFTPLWLAALLLWRRRTLMMAAAAVGVFLAALYAVTIGRGFFAHYFLIAMTGTFFWAVLGTIALGERMRDLDLKTRRWIISVVAVVALSSLGPRLDHDWDAWAGLKPPAPPVADSLIALVKRRTARQDRIWNIGMPGLYVFADRLDGSRIPYMHDSLLHFYQGNTDAERFAPYRAELDRTMPKLVIFSTSGAECARYMNGLIMPFLKDHHYREAHDSAQPALVLYERPN